jgi:hypothetical protein
MSGLTNYSAPNILQNLTGLSGVPATPTVWLALFTAVGTDAGTGFTEVSTSGTAYARVQVSGTATAASTISASSPTITGPNVSTVPWITASGNSGLGWAVYDVTKGAYLGVLTSWIGTTITLNANSASAGSGSTDVLLFSAFGVPSGTGPSTDTNGAIITFAQATGAGWGTVIAWGLYDAATSGNLLLWDFLGNFAWQPVSMSSVGSGNGGVITGKAFATAWASFAAGAPVVCSVEFGGTFPTVTQAGPLTGYTVSYAANNTTDTFTLSSSASAPTSGNAVWTSSTGNFMCREIVQQSIPANVIASFAAAAMTLSAA